MSSGKLFSAQMQRLLPMSLRRDEDLMAAWVESRRAGCGDPRLFEEIYRRHRTAARGRIAAVLGPRHRAHLDDLDQSTWMEVARRETWEPTSFRSFLLTIATRKALTLLERHAVSRSSGAGAGEGDLDPIETWRAPNSGPEGETWARRQLAVVMEIVATMVPERREAWLLRYVEGLSDAEIAERTGWALGTAKTRLRLAGEALAEGLRSRGLDPERVAAEVAEVGP